LLSITKLINLLAQLAFYTVVYQILHKGSRFQEAQ